MESPTNENQTQDLMVLGWERISLYCGPPSQQLICLICSYLYYLDLTFNLFAFLGIDGLNEEKRKKQGMRVAHKEGK